MSGDTTTTQLLDRFYDRLRAAQEQIDKLTERVDQLELSQEFASRALDPRRRVRRVEGEKNG